MLIIESILVYTTLTIAMFFFSKLGEKPSQMQAVYNAIPIILFTLVFGLRYGVGVDYANYVMEYEEWFEGLSFTEMLKGDFEPGLVVIIYLCKLFHWPSYMLFTIVSFIQIILIYASFNEQPQLRKYVYLAFIFLGIAITDFTNAIRQHIAVCFFMCSLIQIEHKNFGKYLLLWILACLFHKSAVIIFPAYFVWRNRREWFTHPIIQVVILFVCFITTFIDILPALMTIFQKLIELVGYGNYLDDITILTFDKQFGFTKYIELFALMTIVLFSNKIKKHFNSDLVNIMYDLFFIGICCKYLFMGSMLFRRMALYFIDFYFVFYGIALAYFKDTFKESIKQLLPALFVYFTLFVTYAKQIYYCETFTGAYVTYFQKSWHETKDIQREELIDSMGF